ncbi:MAG: TrbI/VirB10 family protein [Aulosira sp. ZfuVER01]|nr:TrbI/VirB10 family protein [Aulosira sp. ZfuVER01]MDZ8000311.1 TrbI/VirB10 family protein [Aulosira sp. DedVER01a]MDZ8055511.1 TrbI/VirB10 family protein [Aulosira sp. ZfuCHP01]
MTPYSSSAKSSVNNDYQLELDSLDWELRMAKLVGLENEELSSISAEIIEESATLSPSLSQPSEVKTEQSFSSNPFAKLGLVGTATLSVVLVAGGFLTQLMSSGNQKPKKKNISPEIKSPVVDESVPQELEIETLKTKLALTEQAEAVKLAQQQLRNTQIKQLSIASKPTSKSNAPRIVTVERIVDVPHPPQTTAYSHPVPQPQMVAIKPDIPPAINVTPKPKLDPYQMWSNLAKLGSYGQVSGNNQPPENVTTSETASNPNTSNPNIEAQATNPQPDSIPTPETPTPETLTASKIDKPTLMANKEAKQSAKSIAVGTSVKAVLATAVFGETANSSANNGNEGQKNTFVVRLKEPLKGVDGNVTIPAGTELLVEIRSLSEQGLLQLDVVKAIAKDRDGITETSLPPNAFMIRGSEGKPLIAQQYPNRGSSLASMDMGLFVLGGLGKAAELFNRSESQVVTTNAGGTVVSNTNPQRNILAGVLEGGMNTIVPQISQRNQQAMSDMMQRTNVWFLPAGTEVEIYVNQAMEL